MKDQLSALIDGELDINDAEHLITSAKSGGELKNCWAHYHLIGDAMRGEMHLSNDFSHRVMSALETEPTVLVPNLSSNAIPSINAAYRAYSATNYKSSKFWSVAASVAAVMFVSVIVLQQQLSAPTETAAQQMAVKAVEKPLEPVAIAQSIPTEYLQAHQAAAPSSAAYYIQNASYTDLAK